MQLQFNPMQIIQAIKQGQNPQQMVMDIVSQRMGNTPMGQNILNLAQNNKGQEIENIARNICQQKGIDYDTSFAQFKQMMGF